MNNPKSIKQKAFAAVLLVLLAAAFLLPARDAQANPVFAPVAQAASVAVYNDSLVSPWQDWSWDSTRNLSNTSPVQSGSASVSITFSKAWAGFYLRNDAGLSTAGYTHLQFAIHGGSAGTQKLNLSANKNGVLFPVTAKAGGWTTVTVPLSSLGSPASLKDLLWQDSAGVVQPKFYLDSIRLISTAAATTVFTPTATQTFLPLITNTPPPPKPTATPTALPTSSPTPKPTNTVPPPPTATPGTSTGASIYADKLSTGWVDWSWSTTRNLNNGSPVQGGSASISVTYAGAWGGFYLHTDSGISTAGYDQLTFWVHGGSAGSQKISLTANKNNAASVVVSPSANAWKQVNVPLASLGSPSMLYDLTWQDTSGASSQPVFYLDTISLTKSGSTQPTPVPTAVPGNFTLRVDASAGVRPISPDIYGMNFSDEALAKELRLPVDRYGGNATTRYNWKNDTSNRASDWFFENIPNPNSNPGALPNGSSSDTFIDKNRRTGTSTIMTVPLIGWTPKSREVACGFSVAKYGPQQFIDSYRPDCGNGVRKDGTHITGNNPADTSIAITPTFVQDWIRHLVGRYGTAANGGVKYYNLDNEPMLWHETHRDVHPHGASYDEIRDRTYQYAPAIKAVDPSAKTLGPVLWGWTAYFYSAKDQEAGGSWWTNPQDRLAHGNKPFIEWYLAEMKAYEQKNGLRILDYMDLHYYPQSGVALRSAGDAALQEKRLRSTRSLWDPNYTDESWINEPVRLIPRMRDWVNTYYPGTKLAITEYNFGGLEHINGALTQADILGIFGREGVDLATIWDPPLSNQPGAYAFRIYRNYDGAGSRFGETSVQATSQDQSKVSIYAARRASDGALTLVIINKTGSTQNVSVALSNFAAGSSARVFRYSSANLGGIARQADQAISGGSFTHSLPGSSITVVVIPKQ